MSTKTVLFLCTGNYYRSRFAEYYFEHLAAAHRLPWQADSRGLALDPNNVGPLSRHTLQECARLGIAVDDRRFPQDLCEADLLRSDLIVAVKEEEHRPLVRLRFPLWEERIEYWSVHDLDVAPPQAALPILRQQVEGLVERLCQGG